jgi:hypothetical protein
MQPQTKTADAHHETTDATVLETIVDSIRKIDGENGAGLEIAATEGIEIGTDMELGTGRGVPAESAVAMIDEVSSSSGNSNSCSRSSYERVAMYTPDMDSGLTNIFAQDMHQRATNSATVPARDLQFEMARPGRGPDLLPEGTKGTVALIAETLDLEMMVDMPMAPDTAKMKWTLISRKMPTRMNSRL